MDLPQAAAWRTRFGSSAGLFDFVGRHVSLTEALAVGQLLWPPFVVERGCVLLSERYQTDQFEQWWDRLAGDISAIEEVMNHLHIWDLFEQDDDDGLVDAYVEMAELIAATWRCALQESFPDRSFAVSVDEDDYGPTVTFRSV
jgi:hypothetical protein